MPPRLKKALGQHHLVDGALCRPAVEFLTAGSDDGLRGRRVLEIGPGGGILTAELLAAGAEVTAWELDEEWAGELARRLPSRHLSIVVDDALNVPWTSLPEGTLAAGNLPYQVSTALIRRMLAAGQRVPRAAFLVQKEVGDRLVARAGDGAYGALSVLVAAQARANVLSRVRRGSFRPPPKVEGSFVGLELHPLPLPAHAMPAFTRLVYLAFAQRRKQLRNSLASGWGRELAGDVLDAAGIPASVRAEELDLAAFLRLYAAHSETARLTAAGGSAEAPR